jgi:hypothetical protein
MVTSRTERDNKPTPLRQLKIACVGVHGSLTARTGRCDTDWHDRQQELFFYRNAAGEFVKPERLLYSRLELWLRSRKRTTSRAMTCISRIKCSETSLLICYLSPVLFQMSKRCGVRRIRVRFFGVSRPSAD